MINADKYLKDGVDVEKLASEFYNYTCTDKVDKDMGVRLADFFSQDVKPTLTEDEKVILRNALESGADAILRGDYGLYFHSKPGSGGIFGHLFQFIQPRRRISY